MTNYVTAKSVINLRYVKAYNTVQFLGHPV